MSNIHSTNFLTAKNQINRVSEADLLKALEEVKTNNDNFRKSFKSDNEAMSIKAGR